MKTQNKFTIFLILFDIYSTIVALNNISKLTSVFERGANLSNLKKVIYSEDGLLNFTGLATKYIGSCEEYDVTTEDGYILKLYHIPGNTSNIVLLCPGLLVTSENFLIRGNTSLIYAIARQGFDLWAMNYRGTRHSRRHVYLNPDIDMRFWDYSMNEIGSYDYKAIIDFILAKTGQKQLSVVAHSLGTSAFFVLASERPEYNDKIKIFAALAPVVFMPNIGPTLTAIIKSEPVVNRLLKLFGLEELFEYNSKEKTFIDIVCSQGRIGYELCFNILGTLTGFNSDNIEPEFTSTILGHFPSGTSRKLLIHFVHVYQNKNFVKYDYGWDNLSLYGSSSPPVYDLKKVTSKVALFVARSDIISVLQDVETLRYWLPNVVHFHVINDSNFNHIDYMWGRNAHNVLYPHVIDILLNYG